MTEKGGLRGRNPTACAARQRTSALPIGVRKKPRLRKFRPRQRSQHLLHLPPLPLRLLRKRNPEFLRAVMIEWLTAARLVPIRLKFPGDFRKECHVERSLGGVFIKQIDRPATLPPCLSTHQ